MCSDGELLTDSTEEQSLLTLVCSSGLLALSRDVTVVTLYSTPAGIDHSLPVHPTHINSISLLGLQRSSQLTIILPLSLFCVPCAPVKEARYKVRGFRTASAHCMNTHLSLLQVTVETNHPLVSLSALYPELPLDSTPPNAFGFHTLAGPTVTVVASKYSGKCTLLPSPSVTYCTSLQIATECSQTVSQLCSCLQKTSCNG